MAAIATTPASLKTLLPLCEIDGITLWIPETLSSFLPPSGFSRPAVQIYQGSLRQQITEIWKIYRSFVFCLATGAVVRLIAPLLQDKSSDPAVVVVSETGQMVISLCGGHQGGADQLTRSIALQLGATPVLTGASNELGLPPIDRVGLPFGWVKGGGDWTAVSAAIARQSPVQIIQEAGSPLSWQHWPENHSLRFETDKPREEEVGGRVWISPVKRLDDASIPSVQWYPRVLWLGIGCERGTPQRVIETAIHQIFQAHQWGEEAIAGVATIDWKANEVGLVELCRDRQWPLRCFTAQELRTVIVPNPSAVVEAEVGTPSVAEAAALLAAISVSAASPTDPGLVLPKQIFRLEGQPGALTLAVAQAKEEYTGRIGRLWLVGTGPGALSQITPAAQTAIAQADGVIGYSLYVDLIRPLLRPGQIVEALPITQERQRAERAIELARWGLTVAVISSGDCGIYGMAGLVLEELRSQRWDGQTPEVQVFPGISALQAAASRVGAPLMHDFCAISLSDLLTPWEVIEKRLTAAAQADFVTALYNPKSKTRTEQIAIAQQIFLRYRPPTTPVALVRCAYRPEEEIILTTLEAWLDSPIDMLTTVIIGNQSTQTYTSWMITPRGYLGFDSR